AVGRAQTSRNLDGGHAFSLSTPASAPSPQRSRPAVTNPQPPVATTPQDPAAQHPQHSVAAPHVWLWALHPQTECGRWRERLQTAEASYVPGATLGSAVTPPTGGGRQISPITPSAPGTSLTGRAFGPT